MKTLLVKSLNALNNFFVTTNLNKTARQLLQYPDSRLKDIGVSKHLLVKGAKAYPWRETDINSINSIAKKPTSIINSNIEEAANRDALSAA